MAKPTKDYRLRLGVAAVVAVVAAYIWGGRDLLAYPYRLVAFSFRYANAWAEETHGPALARFFMVLEGLAIVWAGAVTWGGSILCFDDLGEDGGKGAGNMVVFAFVLLVAALPLVPFVWAAMSEFGLPSVAFLAEIASLKK